MTNLPVPVEMIWIDYETTGVPEDGPIVPLEVGLILTDSSGYEIDSFESLILVPGWQSYMNRAKPFVQEMHSKSGLIAELTELSDNGSSSFREHGSRAVEGRITDWLARYNVPKKTLPMTGSSVHFDRAVAQDWMPNLNGIFHYRNQDVSTLKNFCKLLNPGLYKRLPKLEDKQHRPLADLRASIREYRWYRDNFLFVED